MSRSSKKGPFVDPNVLEKVQRMNQTGDKKPVKIWSRSCTIIPEFIGHTFMVHNGRKFLPVYVTERMIGHKFGEFSFTRFYRGHGSTHKEATALT